jgi:septum formation protein
LPAVTGNDAKPRLVLASASPARRRTLALAGIDVDVVVSGVDESAVDRSTPAELSGTLARLKAEAVTAGLADRAGRLVLGCDSVLAFDGQAFGKPVDAGQARDRWRRMRGRHGVLHTGHCLIDAGRAVSAEAVAAATVHFAEISDAEIEAYVAIGEPLAVAGAFTIDGLGGPFVERIDGDPGTVVGLSLPLLRHLLHRLGFEITSLWRCEPGGCTGLS